MHRFDAVQRRFGMPEAEPQRTRRLGPAAGMLLLLISVVAVIARGQTLTPLHVFTGMPDGANPVAALTMDPRGNLYGVTEIGGATNNGTIFSLTKSGSGFTYSLLYSFGNAPDGSGPDGALLRDPLGNLYGTTQLGGEGSPPYGTVFEYSAAGLESILYSFGGTPAPDGRQPYAPLIQDYAAARGNLYGTTEFGGANDSGTVFKLSLNGTITVLHSFSGPDGDDPVFAGVIRDAAGNLYGTTLGGGQFGGQSGGYGVVFKMNASGTILWEYSFAGAPDDGDQPEAGLISDSSGNLWGTTVLGGANNNCGTVFEIDSAGNEVFLYSFGASDDGCNPYAPLLLDSHGNLYGTTKHGGQNDGGTIFKFDAQRNESVLWSFTGGNDGAQPYAGLVMDSEGNLYGTDYYGGDEQGPCGRSGCGAVFEFTP